MLVKKTTIWDYIAIPLAGLAAGIIICVLVGSLLPWIYKLSTKNVFKFVGCTSFAAGFALGGIIAGGILGAALIVTIIINIVKTYYPEIIATRQQGIEDLDLKIKFLECGDLYQDISKKDKKSWNKKEVKAIKHNNKKALKAVSRSVFAHVNEICIGGSKKTRYILCLIKKRAHHGSYSLYSPVIGKNNGFVNASAKLINKFGNVIVEANNDKIVALINSKYFIKTAINNFDNNDVRTTNDGDIKQKEFKMKKVKKVKVVEHHDEHTSLKRMKIEK